VKQLKPVKHIERERKRGRDRRAKEAGQDAIREGEIPLLYSVDLEY
jgi:hypothetical protein